MLRFAQPRKSLPLPLPLPSPPGQPWGPGSAWLTSHRSQMLVNCVCLGGGGSLVSRLDSLSPTCHPESPCRCTNTAHEAPRKWQLVSEAPQGSPAP